MRPLIARTILISTFALSSAFNASAENRFLPKVVTTLSSDTQSPSSPKSNPSGSNEQDQLSEVAALRVQNELIHDFQSSILDTVLWALGVICTIVVFVAGFGWWSNFKLYENDKKRLQEELESSTSERIAQLELRLHGAGVDLTRSIEAKVEGSLNRLSSEISALQNRFTELTDKIEVINVGLQNARDRDLLVHSELRRVEERVWDLKGIPANGLITQMQGLRAELEADLTDSARMTLRRMKELLQERFLNGGAKISKAVKEHVLNGLPSTSMALGVELSEVKVLLESVPVSEPIDL